MSLLHEPQARRSGGIRTSLAVTAMFVLLGLAAPAAPGEESGRFTIDPVMTKGPADAPVTIVEFSDYQ